ncbi:FMN phosphatase YigB (HAD superfamily) [Symbiobacterium terraclitae]|uniref:FMN phosphatase YigB (HAD superfamily) n=1 Tax=Symbiobacterium terraclitae TaxID=557451 RepID=A0ABS4JYJ0_9FIRM|nr:HAD family hydrolase [Symbiobacterium terraclitae]MBP2019519.1 FMN phosphatase YigB (HAD superfamily) [Symbiobacterium terraclitae]
MPPQGEVQWLFFDPSVLLNENGTEQRWRRGVVQALQRRGRAVTLEQVERAWMQAISAPRPVQPLLGAVRHLAPEAPAEEVVAEVIATSGQQDMLVTGLQLALHELRQRFRLGVIGPYRPPGTRERLARFHLSFGLVALSDELALSHRLDAAGKVDPAIFTWALRKVNALPGQAAYASDRVSLGLAPAKMAGLTTIWLRTTNYRLRYPRNGYETPDLTFNSLPEMARALTRGPGLLRKG